MTTTVIVVSEGKGTQFVFPDDAGAGEVMSLNTKLFVSHRNEWVSARLGQVVAALHMSFASSTEILGEVKNNPITLKMEFRPNKVECL